jgi:hypothetical protein
VGELLTTPLPILTAEPLSEADRANIKVAKAKVFDGLVKLTAGTPEHERILTVGFAEDYAPWPGSTFYNVRATWHEGLTRALDRVLNGDEEMDEIISDMAFFLGGK